MIEVKSLQEITGKVFNNAEEAQKYKASLSRANTALRTLGYYMRLNKYNGYYRIRIVRMK